MPATEQRTDRACRSAIGQRRSVSASQDVSRFVGLALRGAPLREFRRGETEVPVWVRFAGAENFG